MRHEPKAVFERGDCWCKYSGPFTSNGAEAGAFIQTQSGLPEPDIQYHFFPNLIPTVYNSLDIKKHGYTLVPAVVTPQSRGRLTLRSTDPKQYPAIHANYLADEADLRVLVEGVKLARRLGQTRAFAPFYQEEMLPGPRVQSDQGIIAYIRNGVQSLYHPVGTCKMGHDDQAVVDEQLRVRGVEGLRVVDASIMPTVVNGNTNAPTIMIAEKIAALLRGHAIGEEATAQTAHQGE